MNNVNSNHNRKLTILGQDVDVLTAVVGNILSWFVTKFFPKRYLQKLLLPHIEEEDVSPSPRTKNQTRCIAVGRPGGKEQLRVVTLKPGYVTCGYNVESSKKKSTSPLFIDASNGNMPPNTVVIRVVAFSINYADCCIRWGLYESANKFVGYPIVPGFDISGVVERVSAKQSDDSQFKIGDRVYGATFFGAYSTRVLVPTAQIRKIPSGLSMAQAASLPAVSLTALYGLYLGGFFPKQPCTPSNRSILIHSCAGGVGSMMVQMSKLLQLSPVVGVVGRTNKVDAARLLGCDVVIDKSVDRDLWKKARDANGDDHRGYAMIADANGVSTIGDSFSHLAPTGRLVVFGFHSNLPMGTDMLHPMEWMKMVWKKMKLPLFNPMDMVSDNKAVLGFNLSFFTSEIDMLGILYDQISEWLTEGKLKCPNIVEMDMTNDIAAAHDLIQSGKSIGKIVMKTNVWKEAEVEEETATQ